MSTDLDGAPDAALEDVAYLSRSRNRVDLLSVLTTGPHNRRDLVEATGASRPTLRRILNEFGERDWVERTADGDYVATAKGEHVLGAFEPLVDAMDAVRTLDDALEWLPTGAHSIGIQHFGDAAVRRSRPTSPMSGVDHLHDRLPGTAAFRCLTHIAPPVEVAEAVLERVDSGLMTAEFVLTGELVGYLRDRSDRRARWKALVEKGATVRRYDGRIPCNLFVVDGTTFVGNSHSEGERACELIESPDGTVRSWALGVIEAHREDARRLDADAFV